MLLVASTLAAAAAAYHAPAPAVHACTRRRWAPPALALDAPTLALGVGTAVAVAVAVDRGGVEEKMFGTEEKVEADVANLADLQSRLTDARASGALTYREVEVEGASVEDDDEVLQRRKQVRARAEAMLDRTREALQEGLDEAVLNQDQETAEEYMEMLQKLEPLPSGIVPTTTEPDYKRWLDEKWVEKRRA